MRRLAMLVLAFALLFQMSWAVAATYCEHESSPKAAMHFGHHAHVHKSAQANQSVGNKVALDDDCRDCHAAHPALLATAQASFTRDALASAEFPPPLLHGSAPTRAPDRPQWLRLA